jgi:threonylcarbamoyladenosine tRNA methylthiotransferase MtaB
METGLLVADPKSADICIVNTCSVTAMADKKSHQAIRSLKKNNPKLKLVVIGCGAEAARGIEGVDFIVPNKDKDKAFQIISSKYLNSKSQITNDNRGAENLKAIQASKTDSGSGRTRALLKIQDGCNNFCAYCIVPHLRGREVSVPAEEVIREAKKLRKMGYQELVLSGVNVGKYDSNGLNLTGLIAQILKATDFPRIRLSSINPQDITGEMINLWAGEPRLCRHFHLSLQSGCTMVLKRMGRPYTAEEYLDLSTKIVQRIPEMAITTDVIVGFPGETEKEFKDTESFIKKAPLAKLHVFRYSKRAGTRAAVAPDQVSPDLKKSRSTSLLRSSEVLEKKFKERFLGQEVEVLFEEKKRASENGEVPYWYGLTSNYIRVKYQSNEDLENKFKTVKLSPENLA